MPVCGAKTRAGGECQKQALKGKKRCRNHGGNNKVAPKGNKFAAKPGGLYSAYMTPGEQQIAANLELGTVDAELRLTRIRLMRALAMEQERADTLELEETVERDIIGAEGSRRDEKRRTRDYSTLIDKLTARIESLETRRAWLMQQALDADLKRLELNAKGGDKDSGPVGKIVIEVVGGQANA